MATACIFVPELIITVEDGSPKVGPSSVIRGKILNAVLFNCGNNTTPQKDFNKVYITLLLRSKFVVIILPL
jgi:hypothetical protein